MFEKFRNKNLKNYGLCPGNYLSAKQELKHIIHLDVNNLYSLYNVYVSSNKWIQIL